MRPATDRPKPSLTGHSVRLRGERAGARVLVLVAAIAALAAGGYLWLARPRPDPPPGPLTGSLSGPALVAGSSPASGPPTTGGGATAGGVGTGGTVVVHVLGKVRHPGVITLPPGSRISEAIKAAGGVRPGAATGTLNLARKVVDGEQIPVGIRPPPPEPGTSPPAPGVPAGAPAGTPVDLNAATAAQLDQLPGVGPVLAQRIVDYRTQHGPFRSVDQLQEVDGIGARRFSELRPMVRV
ncbi:ComEA family DNA-binding protein [Actinomadura roseirufa]|uniref:ComEA family DNA-binding protein n=1 Tax=Actinomadura roseirufa TaxID=2094049 RepID=UPI001041186F|nr:ComEA family DNA-binding protein [Actinomadura roseirufa]